MNVNSNGATGTKPVIGNNATPPRKKKLGTCGHGSHATRGRGTQRLQWLNLIASQHASS